MMHVYYFIRHARFSCLSNFRYCRNLVMAYPILNLKRQNIFLKTFFSEKVDLIYTTTINKTIIQIKRIRNGISDPLFMYYSVASALCSTTQGLFSIFWMQNLITQNYFYCYYKSHSEQHNFYLDLNCVSNVKMLPF